MELGVYLCQKRAIMKLKLSKFGNIDCIKSVPAGYQIIRGMNDSDSGQSEARAAFWAWIERKQIEHYDALVGFERVEAQGFATKHFSKPAHYRPIIETLIPLGSIPPSQ